MVVSCLNIVVSSLVKCMNAHLERNSFKVVVDKDHTQGCKETTRVVLILVVPDKNFSLTEPVIFAMNTLALAQTAENVVKMYVPQDRSC